MPGRETGPCYEALARGHRVFLDAVSLVAGDAWDIVVPRAQRASRITVVVVSAAVDAAWYAREEIAAAIEAARAPGGMHRVVPVYLEGDRPPADVQVGLVRPRIARRRERPAISS